MNYKETALQGCYIIEFKPRVDERGWFARTFSKDEFKSIGFNGEWVQMNHSFTAEKGTLRGMHFQFPPYDEIKLVRCIKGSIYDVVIDIRKDSKTFLKWIGVELTADNNRMLYIPEGFAHGFQAIADNCELIYLHSKPYTPGHEGGIRFDENLIGIKWPLQINKLSDRDNGHPLLNNEFKGI